MRLPGENQLIDTMFLTRTMLQMKLKSGQAQMRAGGFMRFNSLAKHSKNHAALLFDLMRDLENRFQAFWGKSICCYVCDSVSSRHKRCRLVFRWNGQSCNLTSNLKKNLDESCLPRDTCPCLTVAPCSCHPIAVWQHLHLRATIFKDKHIKSKIRTKTWEEHLRTHWDWAATSVEPDTGAPVSQVPCRTPTRLTWPLFYNEDSREGTFPALVVTPLGPAWRFKTLPRGPLRA